MSVFRYVFLTPYPVQYRWCRWDTETLSMNFKASGVMLSALPFLKCLIAVMSSASIMSPTSTFSFSIDTLNVSNFDVQGRLLSLENLLDRVNLVPPGSVLSIFQVSILTWRESHHYCLLQECCCLMVCLLVVL